jgi:broad specificity phosphatase PhoE
LPEIVLVRHGPVALKASGLLSFEGFSRYIATYELSGIDPDTQPSEALRARVRSAATIFASDAPRVIDTLARMGVTADTLDPAFREAPPIAPKLPLLLPAIGWLALARARGEVSPTLREARAALVRRAESCAMRLAAASEKGDVALIGHGWFNRYVAQALIAQGWQKPEGPGFRRPWGFLRLQQASDQ